jgi:peroxiredoxin
MKRSGLTFLFVLVAAPAWAGGEPWIGLSLAQGSFGGVRVQEVMEGSPGQRAGIVAGDEVVAFDDRKVESPGTLIDEVRRAGTGATAKLRLVDGSGHTRMVALRLEPKPDMETLQRQSLLNKAAPDFAPAVQSGAKLDKLSALRGQVVLLDFFATWCGPCVATMPHVQHLHQKLGARGLKVIGVSTESANVVASAAERFHLSYTLASDENEGVSGRYRVFALPTMIVIDRHGIVREVSVADTDAVDAAVAAALKAR